MRIAYRLHRAVIAAIVIAAAAACDGGETVPPTTTTVAPPTTITTTTTPPTSTMSSTTTTIAPTTTTSMSPPPEIVIEQLEATTAEGDGPIWERSDGTFPRNRQYWLGSVDEELLLLSWRWPSFDLAIQHSVDGREWSEPKPVLGLPSSAEPWNWWSDPFWASGIAASRSGVIAIFEVPAGFGEDARVRQVHTSPGGGNWVLEPLPAIDGLTTNGGPFGVAAGPKGFAVWATADERRPRSAVLFVRPLVGDWTTVELPSRGNAWENWVAPAQSDFLARAATEPLAQVGSHPVIRADIAGQVRWDAVPSDSPPIEWGADLLTTTPYDNVPQPTLYWGSAGSNTWYRLPTPDFSTDDENRFWGTDTYTAGAPGITLAGCNCGDHWGFMPEGYVTIEVSKGDYHVTVFGSDVTVDDIWGHPIRYDSRSWFDETTGTLTVPDPDTGDAIVTVTCDEMRTSAREKAYGRDLLSPPPQDLLFSPDGTSWFHQRVNDLFGVGSYVHQSATIGDTVALLVDPTGDAPTPDPPGCQLGIYPEVRPFEIWVATPGA